MTKSLPALSLLLLTITLNNTTATPHNPPKPPHNTAQHNLTPTKPTTTPKPKATSPSALLWRNLMNSIVASVTFPIIAYIVAYYMDTNDDSPKKIIGLEVIIISMLPLLIAPWITYAIFHKLVTTRQHNPISPSTLYQRSLWLSLAYFSIFSIAIHIVGLVIENQILLIGILYISIATWTTYTMLRKPETTPHSMTLSSLYAHSFSSHLLSSGFFHFLSEMLFDHVASYVTPSQNEQKYISIMLQIVLGVLAGTFMTYVLCKDLPRRTSKSPDKQPTSSKGQLIKQAMTASLINILIFSLLHQIIAPKIKLKSPLSCLVAIFLGSAIMTPLTKWLLNIEARPSAKPSAQTPKKRKQTTKAVAKKPIKTKKNSKPPKASTQPQAHMTTKLIA